MPSSRSAHKRKAEAQRGKAFILNLERMAGGSRKLRPSEREERLDEMEEVGSGLGLVLYASRAAARYRSQCAVDILTPRWLDASVVAG